MRTLKYAILGLLNQQQMTGYDLMKQFESALNEFWSANHSQIYPELKKLTEEGLISYEIAISGTVLEKKLYTITLAGKQAFEEWLKKEEVLDATPKDVFRLRLFFASAMTPQTRLQQLQLHLEQHQQRLAHLKKNSEKFSEVPAQDSTDFGDYLVLMGAVMREETTCNWLQKCIDILKGS